jgi:alkylhydroperoxidase family enzyme
MISDHPFPLRPVRDLAVCLLSLLMLPIHSNQSVAQSISLLSDAEAWQRLPQTTSGGNQPLPSWARAVAVHMPRTAAAMLQLDYAQRMSSPLPPQLRAKLRWAVAECNRCAYSMEYARADLKRAGGNKDHLSNLESLLDSSTSTEKKAIDFIRQLTTNAPQIPDSLFASLRQELGEHQSAAIILLGAYGNFQDRIVLGLGLPMESTGPLEPLKVEFVAGALQTTPIVPASSPPSISRTSDPDLVRDETVWTELSYQQLQERLEHQRMREPRLPIKSWEEVKLNLPDVMKQRPTSIVWSLMCYGYVPELAIPWTNTTRTMWVELPGDRVFEESLFWIQTRTIECNYCMGHCEMLLEVAGLDKREIADRVRRLGSDDWSGFSPAEQRSYAFARKLTNAPWTLTPDDYQTLEKELGPAKAMSTFWWLCRGLYMTRISDGFQLPLETENVFGGIPPAKPK